MGLSKTTVRDRARVLLNELIEGFWIDDEMDAWIEEAAIDISAKTLCYDNYDTFLLVDGTALYTKPTDYLKLLGVVYDNHGLKRSLPWMQGLQTAVVDGPPEYFFEISTKIGLHPIPTVNEHNDVVTIYFATTTSLISNIPVKFQTPAVMFTTCMGLLKERQYAKAMQLYTLYLSALSSDRVDVVNEKVDTPDPLNAYVIPTAPRGQ